MKLIEAAALISTDLIDWARPQSWCELGAGKGTFTLALAQLLAPGTMIYAVDFDQRALQQIPDQYDGVTIRKIIGDIESPSLRFPSVEGVLMANTLHFVKEPRVLLSKLASVANRFLIVEYERSRPHRWVPYPLDFERLRRLFAEVGMDQVEKITTRPSLFGGTMYAAFAERYLAQL
jgi:ubiquinone/menaquinone biosynthesis C-methylase UbiE